MRFVWRVGAPNVRIKTMDAGMDDLTVTRCSCHAMGRWTRCLLGGLLVVLSGCSRTGRETRGHSEQDVGQTQAFGRQATPPEPSSTVTHELELGPITKASFREHPSGVAWVFDDNPTSPQAMDIGQAEARGYTVIDLSDRWTPYIFTQKTPGVEDATENDYRKTYLDLANDRTDAYGSKLPAWEHNYLELYGIPPTLSVIANEWTFVDEHVQPCLDEQGFDSEVFHDQDTIRYRKSLAEKRVYLAKSRLATLRKAMRKAKLNPDLPESLEAAAAHPKTKTAYKRWRSAQAEVDVIAHAQKRFHCEQLFDTNDGQGSYDEGVFDRNTTQALASFERKHDLMGWGHFKSDNMRALSESPDESVHNRLLRVVEERVISSAGILEDGSAVQWRPKLRYQDEQGQTHKLQDLTQTFTQQVIDALDLKTPESAKAQLERLRGLSDDGFSELLVAVKLPERPPYYREDMSLSAVIDRGDVWYELPYDDESGEKVAHPRRRYPHITVYTTYNEQKIPLVHWRTTIGSWRNELTEEGEVMLKYKNSDVGDRVWKDIVAAPVWIPPVTTPARALIKGRWINGKYRRGVNYDEIGPGYRSAYGLVAAYHIKQRTDEDGNIVSEYDNSIRTHGSVNYMSILRSYSHGCHRLYNMDAVRLFSFVLQHRNYIRHGQQAVGVSRDVEYEERTYRMRIKSRGYKYELVEPIPITVLEGRILGSRQSPYTEYIPRPGDREETDTTSIADLFPSLFPWGSSSTLSEAAADSPTTEPATADPPNPAPTP